MHEPRDDLYLLEESIGAERCSDLRPQHLERDVAQMLAIVGQIHGRHPAPSEHVPQLVPLGERAREVRRNGSRHAVNIRRGSPAALMECGMRNTEYGLQASRLL